MITFDEFKKTCYHTREYLKIPLCNTNIDKKQLINKKGKYDFEKENQLLMNIYEEKFKK